MSSRVLILALDEDIANSDVVGQALVREGLQPDWHAVASVSALRQTLQLGLAPDLILLRHVCLGAEFKLAIEFCLHELLPAPIIVVDSDDVSDATAAELLSLGASDVVSMSRSATLGAIARKRHHQMADHLRAGRMRDEQDEAQARYRTAVDNLDEGVVLYSAAGDVLMFSARARALLDFGPDHVVSEPEWNLVDERGIYTPPANYPLAITLRTGERSEAVLGVGQEDGGYRWLRHRARALTSRGVVGGSAVLLALTNVTESRSAQDRAEEMESMLRHAQKIQTVGTLAGGIAHDFNNILTPVCGYIDLASGRADLTDGVRDDLAQARKGLARAQSLVRQIVTFSGQDDGPQRIMSMEEVVAEALDLLRATTPSNIEIRHHTKPGCGSIAADPTQIHQVVMNLCTNAARAMPDGGLIEISLEPRTLDESSSLVPTEVPPGDYVRLQVNDTGCGMSSEVISRIFEPFFSTRRSNQGTGLGLSVVHGIVRKHGGGVRVRSTVGRGTSFDIYFPAAQAAIAAASVETEITDVQGSESILFVDDEEDIAQMIPRLLGAYGYQVRSTTRAAQALTWIRRAPSAYDVLITDYTMPRMSGITLAKEAKLIRPDLPILLVTGFRTGASDETLRKAGISDCLMKPIPGPKLAEAIRRVLQEYASGQIGRSAS